DARSPEFFLELVSDAVEYLKFETALNRRVSKGVTEREHLEEAARRGDENAKRHLTGPECPEEVEYLVELAYLLHGRSGVGMTVAPLSFTTVEAFCRLMDVRLEPYEVAALIELDAALFPDVEEAPRRE